MEFQIEEVKDGLNLKFEYEGIDFGRGHIEIEMLEGEKFVRCSEERFRIPSECIGRRLSRFLEGTSQNVNIGDLKIFRDTGVRVKSGDIEVRLGSNHSLDKLKEYFELTGSR